MDSAFQPSLRCLSAFGCLYRFVKLRSESAFVQRSANFLHLYRGDLCRLPAKTGMDKGDRVSDVPG